MNLILSESKAIERDADYTSQGIIGRLVMTEGNKISIL